MQFVRVYEKKESKRDSKWVGYVGKVVLESDVTVIKLNGKPIAESSIEYLLNFALQSLQDAYAGADDLTEGVANFEKKLEAIIAGTLGTRSGGEGVTEEVRVGRQLAQQALKSKLGSDKYKTWLTNDDDVKIAKLDEILAKNAAHFKPLVAEKLAALAAERKRNALAASNVTIDL